MSATPGKKKHQSGSEKRKKQQEQKNKLNEQLKKTPKLFQLGFTLESTENEPHRDSPTSPTPSKSASGPMAVEPVEIPFLEQTGPAQDHQESVKLVRADCTERSESEVESEGEVQLLQQSTVPLGVEYQNDVALWQNITKEVQDFWCTRDFSKCQHDDCDFSASTRQYDDYKRNFSRSMFFRQHVSGGKIKREWLMYSPSTGNAYCLPCILFGEAQSQNQFKYGFSDWKNASQRIKKHENSASHCVCVQALISRQRVHGRIDTALEIQFNKEREYWINVLQRVVSVIKFLSSRGLAFRGDNELLGSQHNGNYLGILELIAEYNPFLSSHMARYGNEGKGKPSYLSSTICEEIIKILGDRVLQDIVNEILEAKYFSISVDSTPDMSHTDQLTVVLRYVTASNGKVAERFLTFIPIDSHKGEELANTVLNFLSNCNIDIQNLRGQSYDNASNMSGCYNGLQAHIKKINKLAHYVPCAAHSLNLVGVRAVESCVGAISFFGFVQALYNFFSASTHRWAIMLKYLEEDAQGGSSLVLKRASDTRWCARADATKALSKGYISFQKALQSIAGDKDQKSEAVHEARCLLKDLEKKENAIMAVFWSVILLDRINGVSKSIQKETIELRTAIDLLKSLLDFLMSQRDSFEDYEMKATEKTDALGLHHAQYSDENQRIRKRKKRYDDGSAEDVVLRGKQKLCYFINISRN